MNEVGLGFGAPATGDDIACTASSPCAPARDRVNQLHLQDVVTGPGADQGQDGRASLWSCDERMAPPPLGGIARRVHQANPDTVPDDEDDDPIEMPVSKKARKGHAGKAVGVCPGLTLLPL
jgi:hypothetical protein